jgi:NADP-dependent 3-hydroxy acid dehydrogenase YdfG
MTTRDQKIAVITGASQRIGASLLTAYRRQSCAVVANSRAIKPSPDPGVLSVAEDISDPARPRRFTRRLGRVRCVDTLVNQECSSPSPSPITRLRTMAL